jgi:MFS family permease
MALVDDIYQTLTDEEDARLCDDIGDAACRETPRSFVLILTSSFLTKLGDAVASPKTSLAWLTSAVGAPAYVAGFLVPIRESGSMIPQLFIGGLIRRLPRRKWVWVAGSLAQCLCIASIGLVGLNLTGAAAGWALLVLLAGFSLARGFCSVAAKDVLGKTVPRPKRGQLTGWSASAAGLLTIVAALLLAWPAQPREQESAMAWLLLGGGGLWLIAAAIYAGVPEFAGETGGGRSALQSLARLRILVTDRPFRRFVITRALLMCSALSAPFYVLLAQSRMGVSVAVLGWFLGAAGLASLLSGPVWGRLADRSSRQVMVAAAVITAAVGLITAATARWLPGLADSAWFLPLAYFVLSVAHDGVRVGRKTYVVNLAGGNRRTDYVAISNSVIGVLLLVVGAVGVLEPIITPAGVIGLLALMGLAGAALGSRLPELERV